MRPNDTILSSTVERMTALQMLDSFPGFLLKTGRVPGNKAMCKCLELYHFLIIIYIVTVVCMLLITANFFSLNTCLSATFSLLCNLEGRVMY